MRLDLVVLCASLAQLLPSTGYLGLSLFEPLPLLLKAHPNSLTFIVCLLETLSKVGNLSQGRLQSMGLTPCLFLVVFDGVSLDLTVLPLF